MSHTMKSLGARAHLHDPEAILSMGNATEHEDENTHIATLMQERENTRVLDTCYENESENSSHKSLAFPKVNINGDTKGNGEAIIRHEQPILRKYKHHASSEPDLTQPDLYSTMQNELICTASTKPTMASQKNEDSGRGTKLKDSKCAKNKDRLTVSMNTKRTSDETVSNKDSGNDKSSSGMRYNRIFKKTSQDGNLVLFLPQRELTVTEDGVEPLMGVALIHESIEKNTELKVFLQIVLIFRYGRDDEELLGLRFCNEVVIAADQIHPPPEPQDKEEENKLDKNKPDDKCKSNDKGISNADFPERSTQKMGSSIKPTNQKVHPTVLANAQGFIAIPFVVNIGTSAPPSVRLIPCRPYSGAPIGTSYEVQLFTGTNPEEIPSTRRKMVSMSLRILECLPKELPPKADVFLEKKSLISGISGSDFALAIRAQLDSAVYNENDKIIIRLMISKRRQRSNKNQEEIDDEGGHGNGHGVRKIKITAIQQVGIALFSSGSFKNCLGNVVIKADSSASRRTSTAVHGQLDSSLEAGKPPLNMQRTNRRRYSLMPLSTVFRGQSSNVNTDEDPPSGEGHIEGQSRRSTDPKPAKNFAALRTFVANKGRKNSNASDVYATRPMAKGNRRFSCMPTDNKPLIPEKNILTGHKCDSKEELEDEDSDLLTEFALEPNEESFSEDIPLKLALETDYSWAAMDDTSKKVSELTHLAPTVYHANKALFIVRVSYFVQVVVFYGLLKRSVTLKLPFILTRPEPEKVLSSNIKDEQNDNGIDEPKRTSHGVVKKELKASNSLQVPDIREDNKLIEKF